MISCVGVTISGPTTYITFPIKAAGCKVMEKFPIKCFRDVKDFLHAFALCLRSIDKNANSVIKNTTKNSPIVTLPTIMKRGMLSTSSCDDVSLTSTTQNLQRPNELYISVGHSSVETFR